MNNQTLTPKNYIQKAEYDNAGQMIWAIDKKKGHQLLLNVRGWGNIQHLFEDQKEAAKFQDEIGEWITAAINEKLTQQENQVQEKLLEKKYDDGYNEGFQDGQLKASLKQENQQGQKELLEEQERPINKPLIDGALSEAQRLIKWCWDNLESPNPLFETWSNDTMNVDNLLDEAIVNLEDSTKEPNTNKDQVQVFMCNVDESCAQSIDPEIGEALNIYSKQLGAKPPKKDRFKDQPKQAISKKETTEKVEENEDVYCPHCGSVDLAYITQYANGEEYKCNSCKGLFMV